MDLAAMSMMKSCETLSEGALNLSDHLPLTVALDRNLCGSKEEEAQVVKIDWSGARECGVLWDYEREVMEKLVAFQHGDYDSVQQVDSEISAVMKLLMDTAENTLPHVKREEHRKKWFNDGVLKSLCAQSREACRGWREAGCPRQGEMYERRVSTRSAVRRRSESALRERRERGFSEGRSCLEEESQEGSSYHRRKGRCVQSWLGMGRS